MSIAFTTLNIVAKAICHADLPDGLALTVHLLVFGANIKYVSERLSHKSAHVTADTYLHITEKLERESLNLYFNYINSLFDGQKGAKPQLHLTKTSI